MDASIVQIISAIGFPIAACIAMACYIKYIIDKYNQSIASMTAIHKSETDAFIEALNNNTLALQELADMIAMENIHKRRVINE